MPAAKPSEQDVILAELKKLGERMSKLEIMGNELVMAQMENAALIEALIEAVRRAPHILLGSVKVDAPPDLDLTSWLEDQKEKGN